MDDYGAFSVISGIDADLYILRGISFIASLTILQIMWKLTARSTLTTWQLPRPRRNQTTA